MSDLATAYVQILPSAKGLGSKLTGILGGQMPSAGKSAGSILGSSIVSTLKTVLISAGVGKLFKDSLLAGAELEQLKGGVEKIFDSMDYSQILADAENAYKDLNMSANEYLATINDVGAAFSATMGDEKGYYVAKTGLQAISDYASGTGKSVDTLSEKFAMITRSTSSYQSIADQFSGILPATSADFLKQAQAAGILSTKYRKLTDVPVAEYQEAVSKMLEKGVDLLGLTGNTAAETANTFSGSLAAMKAAYSNVLGKLSLGEDIRPALEVLVSTTKTFVADNLLPAVLNIIRALPGSASALLKQLVPENASTVVESAIKSFTDRVNAKLPQALDSGIKTATTLIKGITKGLTESGPTLFDAATSILTTLKDYLTNSDNLSELFSAGGELLTTIVVGIINLVGDLSVAAIEVLATLGDYLTDPEKLKPLLEKAGEVGSQIAVAIWENLKKVFNSLLTNYPDLLKIIGEAAQGAVIGSSSLFVPPAATGMNYVPYDDYLVRLHEGEMVLTKAQANSLRGGATTGSAVVLNQYIYSQAQTAADLMREALYEAEMAVLFSV